MTGSEVHVKAIWSACVWDVEGANNGEVGGKKIVKACTAGQSNQPVYVVSSSTIYRSNEGVMTPGSGTVRPSNCTIAEHVCDQCIQLTER